MARAFTRRYDTVRVRHGFRFIFYCDLCEAGYETDEYLIESFHTAFERAQEEAQYYFNMCHKCGKWICDEHYNQDIMQCVECSVLPNRRRIKPDIPATKTCHHCRSVVDTGNCYCTLCGTPIKKAIQFEPIIKIK